MREIPQLRIQTYKTEGQRRRSYYKYVCKEGLYSPLRNGSREPLFNPHGSYHFWNSGYPLYSASKSYVRTLWEHVGDRILRDIHTTEADRERERQEVLSNWRSGINARLAKVEHQTGWCWVHAAFHLGIEYTSEVETLPLDLIEAKQFQMGLTTLIGQKKKADRNTQTKNEARIRTPRSTMRNVHQAQGRESIPS